MKNINFNDKPPICTLIGPSMSGKNSWWYRFVTEEYCKEDGSLGLCIDRQQPMQPSEKILWCDSIDENMVDIITADECVKTVFIDLTSYVINRYKEINQLECCVDRLRNAGVMVFLSITSERNGVILNKRAYDRFIEMSSFVLSKRFIEGKYCWQVGIYEFIDNNPASFVDFLREKNCFEPMLDIRPDVLIDFIKQAKEVV